MPLIIEGNERNLISKIFIRKNAKYNNPYKYRDVLERLATEYKFEIYNLNEINAHPQLTFLVEGCGIENIQYSDKKVCLVYMTDFRHLYNKYIEQADHVIFPNIHYAQFHQTLSPKNLYLGSPKYDIELDKKNILKKYDLTNNKKCVILFPRNKDLHLINLNLIYETLKSQGYELLVKTRGKDGVANASHRGDKYFVDTSWFPHTTMELIEISDFVINFDSTSVEEAIMLNTPLINFKIKGGPRGASNNLPFLLKSPFCRQMDKQFTVSDIRNSINFITQTDFSEDFKTCQNTYLHVNRSSSDILDLLARNK